MILLFDVETSSLDGEIIEAAYLELDAGSFPELKVKDEFCERYKPSGVIAPAAMATHHIIDADLVGCPPSSCFVLPDETQYLIGHNIDFDAGMAKVMDKPIKRICTLALSRTVWPGVSHTQSALVYLLEKDQKRAREMTKGAHGALSDVRACLFVLQNIISELGVESIEELYAASEASRMPAVMPFGKYKGEPLANLSEGYVSWLLLQDNLDPYLASVLKKVQKS